MSELCQVLACTATPIIRVSSYEQVPVRACPGLPQASPFLLSMSTEYQQGTGTLGFPIAVIVQARSGSSKSEAMLGIVDDTEEKSQKDQVVTASKPSKPLLT